MFVMVYGHHPYVYRLIRVQISKRRRDAASKTFSHWKRVVRRGKLLREAFIGRMMPVLQKRALSYSFYKLRLRWLTFRFQKCIDRFQILRLMSKAMIAWKAVMSYHLELRRQGRALYNALHRLLADSLRSKGRFLFVLWRLATVHQARLIAFSEQSILRMAIYRCGILVAAACCYRNTWQMEIISKGSPIPAENETNTYV